MPNLEQVPVSVSVARWNTADVTVRVYILRRDSGNAIKVAQSA